jgi:hypothetical protein
MKMDIRTLSYKRERERKECRWMTEEKKSKVLAISFLSPEQKGKKRRKKKL